jgi:16S rRNA C1402 (ribose-2'-O) methylase RsmI
MSLELLLVIDLNMQPSLSVSSTGNLHDVSLRTLKILNSMDLLACEDTRTTQKLLSRYEVNDKLELKKNSPNR